VEEIVAINEGSNCDPFETLNTVNYSRTVLGSG